MGSPHWLAQIGRRGVGELRETVRRKVVKLIEQGDVYRPDEGYLYLTPTVGDGFTDTNAASIESLIDTARRLERLLAGQPATRRPRVGRSEAERSGGSSTAAEVLSAAAFRATSLADPCGQP